MEPLDLLDAYERHVDGLLDPLEASLFEDPVSRAMTSLEFNVEHVAIPPAEPLIPLAVQNSLEADLPAMSLPGVLPAGRETPIQRLEILEPEARFSFFLHPVPSAANRIRASRAGIRRNQEEIYCGKDGRYVKEKACRENECQYWDEDELPHCTYFSDDGEEELHGDE